MYLIHRRKLAGRPPSPTRQGMVRRRDCGLSHAGSEKDSNRVHKRSPVRVTKIAFYAIVLWALGLMTWVPASGQQPRKTAADQKLETTYDPFVDETTVGTAFTPVKVSGGDDAAEIGFRAAYICSGNQTACVPNPLGAGRGAGDVM